MGTGNRSAAVPAAVDTVNGSLSYLLCLTRKAAIKFHKRGNPMSEPTYEELKAKLSQLEKEVEVKKRSGEMTFKVGEKGGVSVYGLGRFPVTLYYEQWNRLLGAADDIKKFLEENKSRLKLKE
jgi:hypothetical protein